MIKNKVIFLLSFLTFLFCYLILSNNFFFLRDDYDVLLVSNNFNLSKIFFPHNEHFFPILRIFYWLQFKFFGLDFNKYIFIHVLIHVMIGWVAYLIIKELTKNKVLSWIGMMVFWSTIGASYKVVVLLISQIWLFEALFCSLTLLFLIKYTKTKQNIYYFLMLGSLLLTALTSPISIGVMLSIIIWSYVYQRNIKLTGVISILLLLNICFYLNFASLVSVSLIQNNLNILYPLYVLRFVFMATVWGTFIQLIFPWFNLLRPLPQGLFIKFGIAIFFVIGFYFIAKFLIKFWKVEAKKRQYIILFLLFCLGHLAVIGLGRIANLGYTLSPQYTYFPRLVMIIGIIFLFNKNILKRKFLFFLALVIISQNLFFVYQIAKWKDRVIYTKNYMSDLKYVFDSKKLILDLYLPDSISPVTKFSNIADLFYPNQKVDFIVEINVDPLDYLQQNKTDKRFYDFYLRNFEKKDIVHY